MSYSLWQHQQRPSSAATTSLVMGILSAVIGWCICAVLPILAIIFGHIGLAQTSRGATGRGRAIAGLVLGYVLLLPSLLGTFTFVFRPDVAASTLRGVYDIFSSLVA